MATDQLALPTIASGQRGLVTCRDAHGLGMSDVDLARLVRRGVLARVQPQVYRFTSVPPDPLAPLLAAVLSAGGQAVVSMQTAAALHGLDRIGSLSPPRITVPQTYKHELWDVVVHRTRRLEPPDVVQVDGIPCTSGARTLIDLAAVVDRTLLTALVDDAIGSGVVSRSHLHVRALALRNGRTGVGNILLLTADDADNGFRSWLERRAAFVLESAGVSRPRWNEPIYEDGRLLGIADACWHEQRLIVEFDGLRFHSTPQQRRADAERERRLVLAGWRVLRFTWHDVVEQPDLMVVAIRRALT